MEVNIDQVAAALVESEDTTLPEIDDAPDCIVRLPGGLVLGTNNAEAIYDVEVRELTGEHEEIIAKARRSGVMARFVSSILECGIAKIGDVEATKAHIKNLLTGDREFLLMEIRRVTYGDEMVFKGVPCPGCGEFLDVTINLDDIKIEPLSVSTDRVFEVPLRKGAKAYVRLPIGEDQEATLSDPDITDAERNTMLLQRCVMKIADKDGRETHVAARPIAIKQMNIMDRRTILEQILKRQPGPRYDEVSFTHEACGKEVPVPIGLGDLFPYL